MESKRSSLCAAAEQATVEGMDMAADADDASAAVNVDWAATSRRHKPQPQPTKEALTYLCDDIVLLQLSFVATAPELGRLSSVSLKLSSLVGKCDSPSKVESERDSSRSQTTSTYMGHGCQLGEPVLRTRSSCCLWQQAKANKHGRMPCKFETSLLSLWRLKHTLSLRPTESFVVCPEGVWCSAYDPSKKLLYCACENQSLGAVSLEPKLVGISGASIVTAATTFSSEFYHRLRSQILCLVPVSATVEGRLNHGYVSGCADGAIRLWLRGGSSSIVVGRHNDEVSCICMAGTGRVVTGSCDSSVRLWSIPSDDTVSCAIHTHHVGAVLSIIYLGGPLDLVASGSWDCSVVVWSIKHKRLLHAFIGHESSVICLAATVLYGQVLLLSGSADATLQVWDLGPGCNAGELLGHTGSVECIDTLGDCVVTGSADHTVRLWSLEHRVCTRVLLGHTGYVTGVRIIGAGEITSTSADGRCCVWRTSRSDPRATQAEFCDVTTEALAIVSFADAVSATGRQTAGNPNDVETESEAEDGEESSGVAAGTVGGGTCRDTGALPTLLPGPIADYQNGQTSNTTPIDDSADTENFEQCASIKDVKNSG